MFGICSLLAVVLVVEVQLARAGTNLPDEDGSRPKGLVIGPNLSGTPVEVVWLGDSTTTGVGVADFADSMAHRTAQAASEELGRPVSLTILGVSGAQVEAVESEQVLGLSEVAPDVVVISVGANDVTHLTRRPAFRDRYRGVLDAVASSAPEAEVVVVGIPDMGSVPRFLQPLRAVASARANQLDDDVRSAARRGGHAYVDLARETGPQFRRDPDRFFSADEFHPSIEGHALWAEAVGVKLIVAAQDSVG